MASFKKGDRVRAVREHVELDPCAAYLVVDSDATHTSVVIDGELWAFEHSYFGEHDADKFDGDDATSPAHYALFDGERETLELIEDRCKSADLTPYQGYLYGNAIKYVCRAPHKNGSEDFRKAVKYLEWLADDFEGDDDAS